MVLLLLYYLFRSFLLTPTLPTPTNRTCAEFNSVRQTFDQVPSLQGLFKTGKAEVILEYLKAVALYTLS